MEGSGVETRSGCGGSTPSTDMKSAFMHFAVLLATVATGSAQESPYALTRSRLVDLAATTAWKNCVGIVRSAPVIVNTIDAASRLVTFTMPLQADEVKTEILEAKEVGKQPLTLHVNVWIAEWGKKTRLYVRAAPNGGGFFAHENGLVEAQLLDAIQKGGQWNPSPDNSPSQTILNIPPAQVQAAAVSVVAASRTLQLNTASADPAVVTLSLMIPSANLAKFVVKLAKQYYPGAVHLTMWFEPLGAGTLVRTRTLILESGSLSPVPLASNGQLESAVLDAVRKRSSGMADATVTIGSNYRGKPEFWNVLFNLDAPPTPPQTLPLLIADLNVPLEKAWTAALQTVTQSNVIVGADHGAGTIEFVAVHTSQIGNKYAVHRVTLSFASTESGTRMSIGIPRSQETAKESADDLSLYAGRIGTELLIKDRLYWLTDTKGVK